MAILTFNVNAKGNITAQQNAAVTKQIKITGDLKGGKLRIFASPTTSNYGEIMVIKHLSTPQVFPVDFPAATYFYVAAEDCQENPAVQVVMW